MPILQPSAPMGYIGSVVVFGTAIRAKSSTLQAKQSITMPDVVDHRIDRTIYQLGAMEVDGGLTIPVIQSDASTNFLDMIWAWATNRDANSGELINNGDVNLNYSYNSGRTFHGCRVNKLSMKATAGEAVDATLDFMGTSFTPGVNHGNPIDSSPARLLTWNDVVIVGPGFDSCIVKEFSFEINNNCARNFTFCPSAQLFASNISTGKRFVQGSMMFQGFAPTDALYAETNPSRCSSDSQITFQLGGNCGGGFNKTFNHIIFELQQIDIQAGASTPITSTVNWYAFGGVSDTAIST